MSARHFKTAESNAPSWYERPHRTEPQVAEEIRVQEPEPSAGSRGRQGSQSSPSSPSDPGDPFAAYTPAFGAPIVDEPQVSAEAVQIELDDAVDEPDFIQTAAPARGQRAEQAGYVQEYVPDSAQDSAHGQAQDYAPDYAPEFEPYEPPRHRGLKLALLFIVVFAIFFGGSMLFMRLTGPTAIVVESTQPKPTLEQPLTEPSAPEPATTAPAAAAEEEGTLTLTAIGSVLVTQGVWESGAASGGAYDFAHLFAQVASRLEGADVALVQQETALGGTELGLSGYPAYNSPQEIGDAEAEAGADVILHASDLLAAAGTQAVDADAAYWTAEHPGLEVVGLAGSNAASVAYVEHGGIKLAVLDYTADTGTGSAESRVRALTEAAVKADVAEAREQGADAIVLGVHWPESGDHDVSASQREWAEFFAEQGVDVVIGIQPYVLQPVELVHGSEHDMLVFWSIGAFTSTFPYGDNLLGGLAEVTFAKEAGEVRISEYALAPTVTQRGTGTAQTTYLLADYTSALASANSAGADGDTPSLEWYRELAASTLGQAYDKGAGELRVKLEAA